MSGATRKKVDPRIRALIENGVKENHRSLFVLVGDHGKDQVISLFNDILMSSLSKLLRVAVRL